MNAERSRIVRDTWWIAVPFALTAAVSYPITRNYFFGDDLLSVYDVVNKHFIELLLVPYGGHLLIVRNAVNTALYRLFGPDPHAYYWVALLTHLANVVLLCVLLRRLTDSARLACFGGALWGTAPVTEGTIGWFSVYGHALTTTALLLILIGIVRAGRRGTVSNVALATGALLVFTTTTCFGVGLAFAVVLPAVAWLLMPSGPARRRVIVVLGVMAVLMPAVYLLAQHLALSLYGIAVPVVPLATLERMAYGIADMMVGMLAYGTEQIALGPLAHFAGLEWAAVVAIPVGLGIAAGFWRAGRPVRRAMLAFALLAVAAYGIIASGRAPFYLLYRDLLIRSDRYHYAAPLAVSVLVCLALAQVDTQSTVSAALKNVVLGIWLLALATGLAVARLPVQHFDWARLLANQALTSMQNVIDSAPPGEDVYIENQLFRGVGPFVLANPRNFPGWAALFVVFHPSNVVDGHRVFFVEPVAAVRAAASRGVRAATLLVNPDDVAPERVRQAAPPLIAPLRPPAPPPAPPASD